MNHSNVCMNKTNIPNIPVASKKEVESFLNETKFSGYQRVPLPYGYAVPGKDRRPTADVILSDRVRGKSVLDIGTYYGYFAYEAIQRGACKAVGVEAYPERYAIAQRIAELNGGRYTVLKGYVEEIKLRERFDVVLFLNILHHVTDPVQAMRNIVTLCRETVVVEFCLAYDRNYLWYLGTNGQRPRLSKRIRGLLQSWALRFFARHLPLMAVGDREYHRTFYFNEAAFYNLFVRHLKFFSDIEFLASLTNADRSVAICSVAKQSSVSEYS